MPTNDEIINKMPTVIRGSISDIEKALSEARAEGYKQGIAHCEKRDNNPIFNWYVKEFLKEEFLNLGKDLALQEPVKALQEPVKVFADKVRADTVKQIFEAIKILDDKLVNPNYSDLKAIIEIIKNKYKVV